MSKGRLQRVVRKARRTSAGVKDSRRFLGLSLSGGKSDRACIAVIEYFPQQKKLFLSKILENIRAEEFISADLKIFEILTQYKGQAELLTVDVPLSLPKCLRCKLKCPGYEVCTEPEIKYLRKLYQKDEDKKKPKKMYTPYTQRPIEAYLSSFEEEHLEVQHAMGANMAPMTARSIFLQKRMPLDIVETFPKLAVWRLGLQLKINKSQLRVYRNSVGGDEARRIFLDAISDKWKVFFYEQDRKTLVENHHAFDAFICAFAGLLKVYKKTDLRPGDFPKRESWIEIPISHGISSLFS